MKSTSKLLLLLAALVPLTSAYAAPPAEPIQGGYGQSQGQTITCSSDDGRRNYCNVDTSRGVRLSRQISGSPCVQNQTWGFDNRGVWVDRGCRAEFMVGGGGGNWGGGGQGQTITCSSDDGRRNYCNANGANLRNVTMTRQISGSACIQDQTWGVDNRGLWVDRGCRAEFMVGGGGNWGGGGQGQTITCSSDDGRRNYCNANGANLRNVTMTRQISGSACIQDQTWGVDNRGLWVDRGCRAEFMVGGGGNWGGGGGQGQTITCSSDDGRRNYCNANGAYPRDVMMTRQISGSACVRDQTWGVDNRGIWVDRGCRAEFSIRR